MDKEIQASYKNGTLTIKDPSHKGHKIVIPDAKGYVPNPYHQVFVLSENAEGGKAITYSIEDIRESKDSANRLQLVSTHFPNGHIETCVPKQNMKKYKSGEKNVKNAYAKMKMTTATYNMVKAGKNVKI